MGTLQLQAAGFEQGQNAGTGRLLPTAEKEALTEYLLEPNSAALLPGDEELLLEVLLSLVPHAE